MKIYSVYDPEFKPYGRVLEGYDTTCLMNAVKTIPLPESGTAYEPSIPALEATCNYAEFQNNFYGGMPVEIGMCWGRNSKLNCLEYHRDSELNIGEGEYVLLVARLDEVENGVLDTAKVKAFRAPAAVPVEVYATTLHYAPCSITPGEPFRVAIVLPRGSNFPAPQIVPKNAEDTYMTARNKWLLAHPESDEAKSGAHIGLTGENIDLAAEI